MTTDLHRFQRGHNEAIGWWAFRFPNDHTASVVPDPRADQLFRWEVLSSDPADAGRGGVVSGLSTAEVEAKLAAIYNLPAVETKED
jgi:hypothetical protein